jgi:hypothetical protein
MITGAVSVTLSSGSVSFVIGGAGAGGRRATNRVVKCDWSKSEIKDKIMIEVRTLLCAYLYVFDIY